MNKNWAFTLVEVLVVIVILGVVLCLLLPSVRSARTATNRVSCQNNMKQIGVALQLFADRWRELPQARTTDEDGKPLHSWRTRFLQHLEGLTLFKKIDFSKSWDDPSNAKAAGTRVLGYECPASLADGPNTTYLAVVTPSSAFRRDSPRRVWEVPDQGRKTIVVAEVDSGHAVPWIQPDDADETIVMGVRATDKQQHNFGFHALFADGHVEGITHEVSDEQLQAMLRVPDINQTKAAVEK